MDDKEKAVWKHATRRYLHDAEFHARVELAVMLLARHVGGYSAEGKRLATDAAMLGLAMQDVDPVTGEVVSEGTDRERSGDAG